MKRIIEKIISVFLALTMVFSAFLLSVNAVTVAEDEDLFISVVSSVEKAPEGYIGIVSGDDLLKIGKTEEYPINGKYILLNDIDISKQSFIGAPISVFKGIFDGNGYEIKYRIDSGLGYSGLFGILCEGAQVKNLGVSGYIYSPNTENAGELYVGGIAGMAFGIESYAEDYLTIIENCYSCVEIDYLYTEVAEKINMGGIVGCASDGVAISDCVSNCSIEVSAFIEERYQFDYCVGGIAGFVDSWLKECSIEHCYNLKVIRAVGDINYETDSREEMTDIMVGGIAGASNFTDIVKCGNLGGVNSKSVNNAYSGGIVGYTQTEMRIEESFNCGTVTASGVHYCEAGGIAGYCTSSQYEGDATIINCFNASQYISAICGDGTAKVSSDMSATAGGIVSSISSEDGGISVENCYSINEVLSASTRYNDDLIKENYYAGKIVGYDSELSDVENRVKNCYSNREASYATNKIGTLLTLKEMTEKTTFNGFDFDTVWTLDDEADYPYPTLKALDKFNDYLPKARKVTEVNLPESISLNYKDKQKIETGLPVTVALEIETIVWKSSNENVAAVASNGTVTATGAGDATITCTVTDVYGNVSTDTCKVTVSYTILQWIIRIFLLGFIWY